MRTLVKGISLLCLGCLIVWGAVSADSAKRATPVKQNEPIAVLVHMTDRGLLFEVESDEYKNADANYALAELKLKRGDRPILALVEDRAPLSAITQVSEMAINAGFTDIRPYVYWHKTGNMARIEYGKVIKFTKNPDKIERREEQK